MTDVMEEVAALRRAVERLEQGLRLMLETQATHTELLGKLMEAAAKPGAPEDALSDALAQIATALRQQTDSMGAIQASFAALPDQVADAVAEGVRDALKA
jgi:hypothetical protein